MGVHTMVTSAAGRAIGSPTAQLASIRSFVEVRLRAKQDLALACMTVLSFFEETVLDVHGHPSLSPTDFAEDVNLPLQVSEAIFNCVFAGDPIPRATAVLLIEAIEKELPAPQSSPAPAPPVSGGEKGDSGLDVDVILRRFASEDFSESHFRRTETTPA